MVQPPPHAEIPFSRLVRQAVDHLGGFLIPDTNSPSVYKREDCVLVDHKKGVHMVSKTDTGINHPIHVLKLIDSDNGKMLFFDK